MHEYKLERKRRKTLSVKIADGEITVSAPLKMEKCEIDNFLRKKQSWIIKTLEKQRSSLIKLNDFADNEALLFGNKVYLPDKFRNNRFAFYKTQTSYLSERIEYLARNFGFIYSALRFSRAQTRWGSCSGKNSITLNYALLTLPERLSDYVIIHELSHTEFHDHSASFWKRVESILPEYKTLRKELKDYVHILKFFK